MGHDKPGAILLLKVNKDIPDYENFFKRPDSFNKVFDIITVDKKEATVWTLNCPAHYRYDNLDQYLIFNNFIGNFLIILLII